MVETRVSQRMTEQARTNTTDLAIANYRA